jgi:hypothetical protein
MLKKRQRAFAQGFKLMEKIGRMFPNTARNKGKCKWTQCPFCGGRLQVWRETNRGAIACQVFNNRRRRSHQAALSAFERLEAIPKYRR